MSPDPLSLESTASALDSVVGLGELAAAHIEAARQALLKASRLAGSDQAKLTAESLAEDLRVLKLDEIESGLIWLAKHDASEAQREAEDAYPQDDRRVA